MRVQSFLHGGVCGSDEVDESTLRRKDAARLRSDFKELNADGLALSDTYCQVYPKGPRLRRFDAASLAESPSSSDV